MSWKSRTFTMLSPWLAVMERTDCFWMTRNHLLGFTKSLLHNAVPANFDKSLPAGYEMKLREIVKRPLASVPADYSVSRAAQLMGNTGFGFLPRSEERRVGKECRSRW